MKSDLPFKSQTANTVSKKVKPPFPKLVIFNVTALILSFTGYDYEIKDMMQVLS